MLVSINIITVNSWGMIAVRNNLCVNLCKFKLYTYFLVCFKFAEQRTYLKALNTMKFYYWKPDPKRLKSYGHVAIELENGTYISFWPDVKHFRATREGNRITGIKSMCFPSFKDEVQKLMRNTNWNGYTRTKLYR